MINLLRGSIAEKTDQYLVIDIGTIGFEVQVANTALFKIGDTIDLLIHLHWNQEQGPSLFGFQTEVERQVFKLIISCSGMGPKIALAILNQLGATTFLQAVQTNDEDQLSSVSGIGSKKAEQMIVHLRHKVKKLFTAGISIDETSVQTGRNWNDVMNALESLNYSRTEINRAMKHLSEQHPDQSLPFEQLIRKALTFLSK